MNSKNRNYDLPKCLYFESDVSDNIQTSTEFFAAFLSSLYSNGSNDIYKVNFPRTLYLSLIYVNVMELFNAINGLSDRLDVEADNVSVPNIRNY